MNDFKKYQSSKGRGMREETPSKPTFADANESDEEVDAIKTRIYETKQDSLRSTRNALRQVRETEGTAAKTMVKLGEQSAQLNKIDKTVELTNVHAQDSIEKTNKLKTLNKSIFAISIGNPFSNKKKRQEELEKAKLAHEKSVEENERIRKQNYDSKKRVEGVTKEAGRFASGNSKLSAEDRARYTFEDEDPDMEDEINENLNEIGDAVGGLKRMALGMGEELEAQNKTLDRVQKRTDDTSAKIAVSQHVLRKIK
ncbi:Protein transport protein sec9 [Zancudomyces culisetae]|uniref:Protein transport protein sec9 n=1 Tax=Zancudomyces culisetae TaxID=1213189 RepID=A0A1R1PSE3_ZANCU|nr:Protein transport protein sec9 [Zancudomyces culisetae]|eukprot:OMH83905.1 Protein transport protein sec9 [Zancudomyces culisetae]